MVQRGGGARFDPETFQCYRVLACHFRQQLNYIRVVERDAGAAFDFEPPPEFFRHDLNGNFAAQAGIKRFVHFAHASAGDESHNAESSRQHLTVGKSLVRSRGPGLKRQVACRLRRRNRSGQVVFSKKSLNLGAYTRV
jgi:hypothetical protein